MDGRDSQSIKKLLEDEMMQQRVLRNIQSARDNITVTIGRASELSGFSISQLRDWEKKGLLKPLRPEISDARSATGQRQYSLSELDKLAIMRELLAHGYAPSAIPGNLEEIWASVVRSHAVLASIDESEQSATHIKGKKPVPMNMRVDTVYLEHYYWRFYASHALQMSLMLLSGDLPGTYAGLVLPVDEQYTRNGIPDSYTLPDIGESLVGWLGQTRSFCTLLTTAPSFEYPSDFYIVPLRTAEKQVIAGDTLQDSTLIFVQRDERKKLNLSVEVIETVRTLLGLLYEDKGDWRKHLGEGMQDIFNPGVDFTPRRPDMVLTGLTNMIVRLGGKTAHGQNRWHFCYVLLPDNLNLPLQQRSLVVRAMSDDIDRAVGTLVLAPEGYGTSLNVRAFQSGHIVYRQELSRQDTTSSIREIEGPVLSNIAVPIGGETGEPLGVLYVASYESHAFSQQDCRVLRVVARIIEELLDGYSARKQLTANMMTLIKDPETVDPSFGDFSSENEFIYDIQELLENVQAQMVYRSNGEKAMRDDIYGTTQSIPGEISFIAIDIDNQDQIVRTYDEQKLRILQKTVGQRIRDMLPALFTLYTDCKLYHIYAGRFYLFLRGFSLEVTKNNAHRLKKAIEGNIAIKQSGLLGSTLIIPDVSIRLAVTWYPDEKLQDFLDTEQYHTIADVCSTLYRSLDSVLKLGMDEGGNVIYAWDPEIATYGLSESEK